MEQSTENSTIPEDVGQLGSEKQKDIFMRAEAIIRKSTTLQKAAFYAEVRVFHGWNGLSDSVETLMQNIYDEVEKDKSTGGGYLIDRMEDYIKEIHDHCDYLNKNTTVYISYMYQLNGMVNLFDQYQTDVELYNDILKDIEDPGLRKKILQKLLDKEVFKLASIKQAGDAIEFSKDSNIEHVGARVGEGDIISKVNIIDLIANWSRRAHETLMYAKTLFVAMEEALKQAKAKFPLLERHINEIKEVYSREWFFIKSFSTIKISDIDKEYKPTFEGFEDQTIYPNYNEVAIDQGLKEKWKQVHLSAWGKKRSPYK